MIRLGAVFTILMVAFSLPMAAQSPVPPGGGQITGTYMDSNGASHGWLN